MKNRYIPLILIICTFLLLSSCFENLEKNISKNHGIGSAHAMVLINGGSFIMGQDNGNKDEGPTHKITLASFYMVKTEVIQAKYHKIMGVNPSFFKGQNLPVDSVSWLDAISFCNKRSMEDGLIPSYDLTTGLCDFTVNGYRLPTEAQWEFAAGLGKTKKFFFDKSIKSLDLYSWNKSNSQRRTHLVSQKKANQNGLYDIYGNVFEWCHDWYSSKYYLNSVVTNPRGPLKGKNKVLRGGSYASGENICNNYYRFNYAQDNKDICIGFNFIGFRCIHIS